MTSPNFVCPICSKIFPINSKLKAHIGTVHAVEKAYKCYLCRKEFINTYRLKFHVLHSHEGLPYTQKKHFKCTVCVLEIQTENQLIDHMRTHTGERPFTCTFDECGMAFKLESTLKRHIQYKHSGKRPLKCKFPGCRFTAKTDVNLISHKKVHSNDRPFPCPNDGCNFRAKERCGITRHIRSVHSEARAFACSKCDYKTKRSDTLKYHMHCHTTKRGFKCSHPQCTESFKTSHDLKLHFSNRHEERNIQCDHPGCGRKYANARAVYKHKWEVHSKKSIACPNLNCAYSTNKPTKLAAHVITHDKRNKILCPNQGCEYKGRNTRTLEMHLRCHETLSRCPVYGCSLYTFSKDELKNHAKIHNPVGRPFQCPLCFKHYRTRDQLRKHTAVHTKEKPFRCGHCEFASSVHGVRTHISSMHAYLKFPFIVYPLDDRECVRCKVTLSLAEFLIHSMGHVAPVVRIARLETRWS